MRIHKLYSEGRRPKSIAAPNQPELFPNFVPTASILTDHQKLLEFILKLNSENKDAWTTEWEIDPSFMVDLEEYGAGNCMCGHLIRYQYRMFNKKNHRELPVGSVCIKELAKMYGGAFTTAAETMERLANMANIAYIKDNVQDPREFYERYHSLMTPQIIESLAYYGVIRPDSEEFKRYKKLWNARRGKDYPALKEAMLEIVDKFKKFYKENISSKSHAIKVKQIKNTNNPEELARQLTLPF